MPLKFNIFRNSMNTQIRKSFFILTILILVTPVLVCSQKMQQSEGKSEVRQESNMTKDQAQEKAEELAKINAIENAFGSYVEQQSDIRVQNGRVNYDILGGIQVRGEWIRTKNLELDEETRPVEGKYGKEQELWIVCRISGEVRECVSRANLDILTLNCPLKQCRTTSYFNKEDLFLYFTSPVDGFLSVFLDDGENAFRLLPYKSMGTLGAVKVIGDKEYIFFSKERDYQYDSQYPTDAMELFTEKDLEYNSLYIVFAESQYIKPILNDIKELEDGYLLPKSVTSKVFNTWLADCRAGMTDFQAFIIKISIEKN
jgi:hypothetical protein